MPETQIQASRTPAEVAADAAFDTAFEDFRTASGQRPGYIHTAPAGDYVSYGNELGANLPLDDGGVRQVYTALTVSEWSSHTRREIRIKDIDPDGRLVGHLLLQNVDYSYPLGDQNGRVAVNDFLDLDGRPQGVTAEGVDFLRAFIGLQPAEQAPTA